VKRGIYGTDDQIVVKLADRFKQSKAVADDALAKLPGTHSNGALTDILDELASREARISTANVPSRDLARVNALKAKNEAQGLTMSEINEAKRLYERNVTLGYLKENNTEAVARATNLDDALRDWQFKKAKELGLQNLDEINRETRLARQLGDSLFKKMNRSGGNNAFGLTDAILISGGDPQAISMLVTKKTFGNKSLQSSIAQKLAPAPTVGAPRASLAVKPILALPSPKDGYRSVVNSQSSIPLQTLSQTTRDGLERLNPEIKTFALGYLKKGSVPVSGSSKSSKLPIKNKGNLYYPPNAELPTIKFGKKYTTPGSATQLLQR
jgi:uncharacterized protein YnzC (UPF0291/DUF896 family)